MQPFYAPVKDDFSHVNQFIIDQLHSDVGLVENIGHYLIEAGGKRLRPLLVLLVSRALTYSGEDHIKLAAIIEFIHTATLLHDDVVDTSNLRRGRLTANAKWGNAPSVLVGDFLYSRAFQLMVKIGDLKVMDVLADTTNVISEGEVQQLVNAKNPAVNEDVYREVIYKKTGILFAAACETAAVLAHASDKVRHGLRQYGYHVGMAFQLVDDVLDYSGDADELGKNVGDDLAEGKPTLPLIYAMKEGSAEQAEVVANALRESDMSQLKNVIEIVKQTGGLGYTRQAAQQHVDQAVAEVQLVSDSPFKTALIELAQFSTARNF